MSSIYVCNHNFFHENDIIWRGVQHLAGHTLSLVSPLPLVNMFFTMTWHYKMWHLMTWRFISARPYLVLGLPAALGQHVFDDAELEERRIQRGLQRRQAHEHQLVGSNRCCSPRHRKPCNSRDERWLEWRAIPARAEDVADCMGYTAE